MLRQPCEPIVRRTLPAIRALIAKALVEEYGVYQKVVAEKLDITQAAVSHYLGSKRGFRRIAELRQNTMVQTMVAEVTQGIASGRYDSDDITVKLCEVCEALRSSNASRDEKGPLFR